MARALRITASAVIHVALLTAVLLLVAMGVGPRTGAYRTLSVLSGSMSPEIPAGSVVVVTPEPAGAVRPGQIITYQIPIDDHRVVSHRVVRVVEGGAHPVFQTKGDANAGVDPWLARVSDTTVWRVRFVVPVAGRVIASLRSPVAHKAMVFGIPALLALIWIADIWKPRKGQQEVRAAHG